MIEPEDCRTMAEVRDSVDTLDRQILTLIGRRFRLMDAAARIKTDRGAVRDEARKAMVIANAKAAAAHEAVPEEFVGRLWDLLVEESIAYELDRFDQLQP